MGSKRAPRGRPWLKGESGNPGGRPKAEHVRELARHYTDEAVATLAELMRNPETPPSVRAHAAEALLDRGWGRPAQGIEDNTPESVDVTALRASLAAKLDRLAEQRREEQVLGERSSTTHPSTGI